MRIKKLTMLCMLLLCVCAAVGVTNAASASTSLPDTWNIKDCVNSPKIRSTRDACEKISTKHDEVEKCILQGSAIYEEVKGIHLDLAQKLIDDYDASAQIKAALKRDLTNCGKQRLPETVRTCTYQVITKRCLMDPALKGASRTG